VVEGGAQRQKSVTLLMYAFCGREKERKQKQQERKVVKVRYASSFLAGFPRCVSAIFLRTWHMLSCEEPVPHLLVPDWGWKNEGVISQRTKEGGGKREGREEGKLNSQLT